MRCALVIVALLAACRGDEHARPATGSATAGSATAGSGSANAGLPRLPISDDGNAAMRQLDADIEHAAQDEVRLAGLLLDRAAIRGWLEDYTRALAVSQAAIEREPRSINAQVMRARVQLAVHAFADARATLATLVELGDKKYAAELQVDLDQATGKLDAALAARKTRVGYFADAMSVTLYAATLAEAGRIDEAIAQIPLALEHLRSNTPQYLAWLLFQWGRLYEDKGELALARDYFAEAHRRLPAHVETTAHLAQAMAATRDTAGARALVTTGGAPTHAGDAPARVLVTADDLQHPSLLALAATLTGDPARLAAATTAWERYVAALPAAFADHAARFYLGVGNNSKRALELAEQNLANRDVPAAHALVLEAALAEGDPVRACGEADQLAATHLQRERFLAWRAYTACGQVADAERLAKELGIARQ